VETTPTKLLDQAFTEYIVRVRACPEPAEATPLGSLAVAGQHKHSSICTE
jgi:hypothetical protein